MIASNGFPLSWPYFTRQRAAALRVHSGVLLVLCSRRRRRACARAPGRRQRVLSQPTSSSSPCCGTPCAQCTSPRAAPLARAANSARHNQHVRAACACSTSKDEPRDVPATAEPPPRCSARGRQRALHLFRCPDQVRLADPDPCRVSRADVHKTYAKTLTVPPPAAAPAGRAGAHIAADGQQLGQARQLRHAHRCARAVLCSRCALLLNVLGSRRSQRWSRRRSCRPAPPSFTAARSSCSTQQPGRARRRARAAAGRSTRSLSLCVVRMWCHFAARAPQRALHAPP
jgi:hypothetical protein